MSFGDRMESTYFRELLDMLLNVHGKILHISTYSPHYWHFVQGIRWSPVDSLAERQYAEIKCFPGCNMNKAFNKTVELIWVAITLMWRHYHDISQPNHNKNLYDTSKIKWRTSHMASVIVVTS